MNRLLIKARGLIDYLAEEMVSQITEGQRDRDFWDYLPWSDDRTANRKARESYELIKEIDALVESNKAHFDSLERYAPERAETVNHGESPIAHMNALIYDINHLYVSMIQFGVNVASLYDELFIHISVECLTDVLVEAIKDGWFDPAASFDGDTYQKALKRARELLANEESE